ncbi:hypothetical protein B0H14DRAFT_2766678 [Mycena olivaceomarginata]|nr:hypothetical protein B0H14DRAFT_2766678 [Mycena olivaceomarginata]
MFVLLTFSRLLVSRKKCVLFPHHPCLSTSLFLAFSSLGSACFSPITHFVLLTFSHLLVHSECVLFPHHPCLSCSLFPIFLPLANCKIFHSFHSHPHYLFCLKPYTRIWNEGLLETWDSS